jgi:hypothetical protein
MKCVFTEIGSTFFRFLNRLAEKVQNDHLSSTWNSRSIEYHHVLYLWSCNISITSMEVDFWGVVRIHMLPKWNAQTFLRKAKFHTKKEVKWTSKPQKIQNCPASIPHFPAETTFWSKFFHNTDVVRGFSEQWKWKPHDFYFRGFDVYFAYFPVWNFTCQICGLIRQAKRTVWVIGSSLKIEVLGFFHHHHQIYHLKSIILGWPDW